MRGTIFERQEQGPAARERAALPGGLGVAGLDAARFNLPRGVGVARLGLPAPPSCRAARTDQRYDSYGREDSEPFPFHFNTAIHEEPDDVGQVSGCAVAREAAHSC